MVIIGNESNDKQGGFMPKPTNDPNGAGFPSKTGRPSGPGRGNNQPGRK